MTTISKQKKYLLPIVVVLIITISLGWIPEKTKFETNENKSAFPVIEIATPPVNITLNSCKLTRLQLIDLLRPNVRKILFQFGLDANNNVILVAYGANFKNEILSGPFPTTVVPDTGIPMPAGGVLGNMEFRRGQLKELFGHPQGKHERIKEELIHDILISPDPVLNGIHVIYKITDPLRPALDGLPTNPSPPDNPCENCEFSGTNNG